MPIPSLARSCISFVVRFKKAWTKEENDIKERRKEEGKGKKKRRPNFRYNKKQENEKVGREKRKNHNLKGMEREERAKMQQSKSLRVNSTTKWGRQSLPPLGLWKMKKVTWEGIRGQWGGGGSGGWGGE